MDTDVHQLRVQRNSALKAEVKLPGVSCDGALSRANRIGHNVWLSSWIVVAGADGSVAVTTRARRTSGSSVCVETTLTPEPTAESLRFDGV